MDTILERSPYAVKQAHERIIGGRQVANEADVAHERNLWRRLVLPLRVANWSLTSLQQRLVKTGAG